MGLFSIAENDSPINQRIVEKQIKKNNYGMKYLPRIGFPICRY